MRMRYKTHRWLCSLIFCCAGLGMAQTSSTSDSATQSQSVESSVSASVNASANAGVSESEVSGSGSRSGNSSSRSALSTASVSELSALQSAGVGVDAGGASREEVGRVSPSASINSFAGLSAAELRAAHGNRSVLYRNAKPANRQTATARDSGKPGRRVTVEELATYSAGFADSTKGTALISPPDPGTSSPLDWTPELHFGFPAFDETQFLNPSLQSGVRVGGRKGPRRLPGTPAPSSAIDEQLGLKTPSIDQEILGERALSTSVDEQLGLQ